MEGLAQGANAGLTLNDRYRFAGKEEQRFGQDPVAGASRIDLGLLDFGARLYDPFSARWTTRDPLARKYLPVSPYGYCAGNPVNLIDARGEDIYLFSENGEYQRKIDWEGEHCIAVSSIDKDGHISVSIYSFADPENDSASIDNGSISNIVFVSEREIKSIIEAQDGFQMNYLSFGFNSFGGQKLDYSDSYLKDAYSGKEENGEIKSKYLFIPEGESTAHNLMNFGNFLWGATGVITGFSESILKLGANINSLLSPRRNGYYPQLDSKDDQLSISQGASHAKKFNYEKKK